MHIKPKKGLGQNFLFDKNIQKKIIDACDFKPTDNVLEIGSGRGELTRLIAARAAFVSALEIDSYLCRILANNLTDYANVRIINRDILKFNLKKYFSRFDKKLKVVGNIPYYITTPIFEHLFTIREMINTIYITVQKEFAQRITASAGSKVYGAISCFIQYYTEPRLVFYISKNSFFPAPKVDSCLLCLKMNHRVDGKVSDEKKLFRIIRASFNQRRKVLRNSLKGIISQSKLNTFFERFNINPDIRPEGLSLSDFMHLSKV